MKPFGLRVDVCHLTALTEGVLPLLDLFERLGVRATFFVALGPDNAGRGGLRRILKPGFLRKMWRSRAWKMYGWRTITAGWVGRPNVIAESGRAVLEALAQSKHEIGLHGWDHAAWQDDIEEWQMTDLLAHLSLAARTYEDILGRKPSSTAAPGWRMTPTLLHTYDICGFDYVSDSRGDVPFRPRVDGCSLQTLQIPVTLPTLDEWMAGNHPAYSFFSEIRMKISRTPFSVLAAHAETEGRMYLKDFGEFLRRAREEGLEPAPLAKLARDLGQQAGEAAVALGTLPGRTQNILLQQS